LNEKAIFWTLLCDVEVSPWGIELHIRKVGVRENKHVREATSYAHCFYAFRNHRQVLKLVPLWSVDILVLDGLTWVYEARDVAPNTTNSNTKTLLHHSNSIDCERHLKGNGTCIYARIHKNTLGKSHAQILDACQENKS
jgi:hypothetical protein